MSGECSHRRLELALAGQLEAREESELQFHLDDCENCSFELERLAGGGTGSREIVSMLISDELDEGLPHREDFSAADFVVHHLDPSDDSEFIGRLGGYDIVEIIGRGGMGVVLKGYDRELKRFVAIKALAPHLSHSALAGKRFAREAQAAAAVVNPHVIAIHQVQPNARLPFLVMPLLTGESLAQRLKARGAMELKEVLRVGMQCAEGLAAAHAQGLIHRDVKPANILLEKGVERAVLTDFGLARAADDVSMTRMGIIAGTPEYMSPEQARGDALDGRSDLFSLGCVLYEMATGVSPFRTDSTLATLRRVVDEEPAALTGHSPELPPWFCDIVERLLSKDKTQRFPSASEVRQLLEQCLSHLQQPSTVSLPSTLSKRAVPQRSSHIQITKGRIAMSGSIGLIFMSLVLLQATEAPDISGQWSSEDWGTVILQSRENGRYEGTFAVTDRTKSGEVQLEWSRMQRRFNGTWKDGDQQSGQISLRLVDDVIRGALTIRKEANAEDKTPDLADFWWVRSSRVISEATSRADTHEDATKFDKSVLPKVSRMWQCPTTVLNGLVNGGGIIERVDGSNIHFLSGDRIQVPSGTSVTVAHIAERGSLPSNVLEPGLAITYSIRNGKLDRVFLIGVVEEALTEAFVQNRIKELQLRKGNEMTTSIDGRQPIRITGQDGEVTVRIGETRLIRLPEPSMVVQWQAGDFAPESVDDIEPFEYVLVQWRDNGRISFICYSSPAR